MTIFQLCYNYINLPDCCRNNFFKSDWSESIGVSLFLFLYWQITQLYHQNLSQYLMIADSLQHIFHEDISALRCGCYIRNPQAIGLQIKKALVPLRNLDYHLEIVNSLLNITLKQRYYNPTDKFLEVDYSLPISPESSIYKFEAEFADVKIQGIVKQKEEAKKEFEQAKKEGRQAVLGTIDADSKDILNMEIGNIPPKTQFSITISLLQELKISLNTFYRVQVPSTISPRYLNKVEGITKVPEHMKSKGNSNREPDFDWTFKVDLKTFKKVIFFDSPSHKVTLINQNQTGTQTLIVMQKSQTPNKDFVFLYTTENFHLPSHVLGNTDASSTIMLSFIPKFCTMSISDAYKASIKDKSYEVQMSSAKGDYVFFLDRSGSMGGTRITKARQALVLFLKSLPEDSYFNVISFGSSSQKMFDKSAQNNAARIDQAIKDIEKMDANLGGTQIYHPLKLLLEQKVQDGYPRHIYLLTDGGVSNTQGVLNMVKNNTKYSRVHTIGIGNGASLDLIQGCAKNGKGKSVMISDNENPASKIIELLEESLTPIISKVQLKTEDNKQIQSIVPNPASIPYILKDDVINFFITYKGPLKQKQSFTFSYEDSVSKLPYSSTIQVSVDGLNQPFVDKMAHLKVLRSLESSAKDGINIEDQMYYVKTKDYKQEAIKYSVKHQVLSEYTAFICVSKRLQDGEFQEFLNKGIEQIHVQQHKPIEYDFHPTMQLLKCSMSSIGMAPQRKSMAMSYEKQSLNRYHDLSSQIQSTFQRCSKLQQICDKSEILSYGSKKLMMAKNYNKKSSSLGIGNIFKSIGSKISSLFQSKDSEQIESKPQQKKIEKIEKEQEKEQRKQAKQKKVEKPMPSSQQSTKITVITPPQYTQISAVSINQVVKEQAPNGSWNNITLIEALSKNPKQTANLVSKLGNELVVTHLVILWLQKYHTDKQYALILKKAISWLKKVMEEKGVGEDQLRVVECK